MGTTRADGRRRLDEEAWEQRYDVATVARWCPVNRDEDRELAMRKLYRESHKRNLRPRRQVEPSASRGMGPTKCSWVFFTRSKPMRPLVAILELSLVLNKADVRPFWLKTCSKSSLLQREVSVLFADFSKLFASWSAVV